MTVHNRTLEAACWRIWYRLKVKGKCSDHNLMTNCGIHEEVFEEAIGLLLEINMVHETGQNRSETNYRLERTEPQMMMIFPTIHD